MGQSVALVEERWTDLVARARREVDAGVLPSCQLAAGLDGEVVAFEAIGDATTRTRYSIFSATKAFVAAAAWRQMADGLLSPTDRVVDHFGEFGAEGKDVVTVEQLLTHTAGFPQAPMPPRTWADRAARVERMATWRLDWEPGSRFEYHPTSAHWVLGEVLARIDGLDHRDVVRRRVLDPLGLTDTTLGTPVERQGDVATLVASGEPPSGDELSAAFGTDTYDLGEVTPDALLTFNESPAREVGVPGAGAISTAADLAAFYQALLHNPGGLFDAEILADATGTVRVMLPDPVLRTPAFRTLGLIAAGDDGTSAFRGMGHNVSSGAFGHNGAGGQIAWADPGTGLSFCYLTNGVDRNFLREARRISGIASRAALLTTPVS